MSTTSDKIYDAVGDSYKVRRSLNADNEGIQHLRIDIGTGTEEKQVSATNPLPVSVAGTVAIHDGTTKATVRELGTNDALNISICDDTGAQMGTTSNPIATTLFDMALTLKRLFYSMAFPGWLNRAANRLMCQSTIESGTVTTVTTVTTVANLTYIGSSPGDVMQRNLSAINWAQNVRSRIT